MKVVALVGGVGRLDPDGTVAQLDVPFPSLTAFLRAGQPLADLAKAAVVLPRALEEAPVAPAAGAGATVWGVGLNYRSKQIATGRDVPDHPVLFVKSAGSIAAAGAPITLPQASSCVDYEGEIAVLIGAPLFEATHDEAAPRRDRLHRSERRHRSRRDAAGPATRRSPRAFPTSARSARSSTSTATDSPGASRSMSTSTASAARPTAVTGC